MNTPTTSVEEVKEISCPLSIIKCGEGQSFEDFKKERKYNNKMIVHFLKGILFHSNGNGIYNVGNNAKKRLKRDFYGTSKKVNVIIRKKYGANYDK